jgi:hypothetical protein
MDYLKNIFQENLISKKRRDALNNLNYGSFTSNSPSTSLVSTNNSLTDG